MVVTENGENGANARGIHGSDAAKATSDTAKCGRCNWKGEWKALCICLNASLAGTNTACLGSSAQHLFVVHQRPWISLGPIRTAQGQGNALWIRHPSAILPPWSRHSLGHDVNERESFNKDFASSTEYTQLWRILTLHQVFWQWPDWTLPRRWTVVLFLKCPNWWQHKMARHPLGDTLCLLREGILTSNLGYVPILEKCQNFADSGKDFENSENDGIKRAVWNGNVKNKSTVADATYQDSVGNASMTLGVGEFKSAGKKGSCATVKEEKEEP